MPRDSGETAISRESAIWPQCREWWRQLSAGALAVVDAIHRTVDGRRVVARQECDRLRYIDGRHEAARRSDAQDQVPVGVVRRLELRRLGGRHAARAHRVDAQLLLGEL